MVSAGSLRDLHSKFKCEAYATQSTTDEIKYLTPAAISDTQILPPSIALFCPGCCRGWSRTLAKS